jgi:hypothetical protein
MADFVEMARHLLAATACTVNGPKKAGPKECISAEAVLAEAVELEDSTSTESAKISADIPLEPTQEELAQASALLTRAGIRLMRIDGADHVGIWSDLDGPEVRAALLTYGSGQVPIRYLDGDCIPMKYKLRKVPGEPVPINVLIEMEKHPKEPWIIRDRMLEEMNWSPNGIPWAGWKAASLNRLLLEQGVTGQPGRIKAGTVEHGEPGGAK